LGELLLIGIFYFLLVVWSLRFESQTSNLLL